MSCRQDPSEKMICFYPTHLFKCILSGIHKNLFDYFSKILLSMKKKYHTVVVNTSRSFPHSWLIIGFVTRLTRRVPLIEQELYTLPGHLSSPQWDSCYSIFRFMCMFCRSLFVLLYLFFWPFCSLFFFDIRILITRDGSMISS